VEFRISGNASSFHPFTTFVDIFTLQQGYLLSYILRTDLAPSPWESLPAAGRGWGEVWGRAKRRGCHFDSFSILNAPCPTIRNTIDPTIKSGYLEFVK